VYAKFPVTYWGFQHSMRIVGKRASLPPLGLVTVAAILPKAWNLRLVDINVEPLTDDAIHWADVVLVGGMLIQEPSMRDTLRRARALGKRTVVGGPAASTAPEHFPEADVVFGGEVEEREDKLIALIEGREVPEDRHCESQTVVPLRKDARPSVRTSPVPRFDLLKLDAYVSMCIQYSRGCPFRCEFCDIIEIFGRVPRVKDAAQVRAELDALLALGWRGSLFIVDDNFIGNIKSVRRLLPEIRSWQEENGWPVQFYTEASVNLVDIDGLVPAMVDAGFTSGFLGIAAASPAGPNEGKKT